jgi:hypothetical protein
MTATTATTKDAHRASIEDDTAKIASGLQEALGQKMAAYILDVKPQTFAGWTEGTNPRGPRETSLRHLWRIYKVLSQEADKHTIRAWLIGMNPMLEDDAPADVFREGRHRDVLTAAQTYLETS